MTALRMAARRIGLIDATPPQATRGWLSGQFGIGPRGPATRQLFDAAVHLAVGVAGGAVYCAFLSRRPRRPLGSGLVFGLGVWTTAFGILAPGLGITRFPLRGTWSETAVNVAAQVLYGSTTALVTKELQRQTHGMDSAPRALRGRVG